MNLDLEELVGSPDRRAFRERQLELMRNDFVEEKETGALAKLAGFLHKKALLS